MLCKNFNSLEKDFDANVKKYEYFLVSMGEEVDTTSISFAEEVKLLYCNKFLKVVAKRLQNKLFGNGINSCVQYDDAAEEFIIILKDIYDINASDNIRKLVYPISDVIQSKLKSKCNFVDALFEPVLNSYLINTMCILMISKS